MKLILFLGILCSFSIIPFIHADDNEEPIDYSDPAHVYEGRIKYSDPVLENMIPSHVCNCVTFRFDDIQNYWLPDVQFEMLKTFRDNNVPVTIGIIGNALEGEMADYIKNSVNSENSNLELANHGWVHENFRVLDKEQQSQLIKQTNEKIFNVTGIVPESFIPPMGEINESIFEVLQENNFTTFSGLIANSPPPYPVETLGIQQFPETAFTAVFKQDSRTFQGISHIETLKDIEQSQKKFGFSVIALHPQDFALMENGAYVNKVNQAQIHELVLLIEEIQKSDLKIVYLNQISENLKQVENQETESISDEPNSEEPNTGGCLIATATYDSELAPQVQQLRELRDNKLLQTKSGSAFMNSFNDIYYSFSPRIADLERENPIFKETVKIAITPMISSLSILNHVDMDTEAKVLGYGISLILLNVGMYAVIPVAVIVGIKKL